MVRWSRCSGGMSRANTSRRPCSDCRTGWRGTSSSTGPKSHCLIVIGLIALPAESVLSMLMVVNPGIQVYPLDADGKVADYLGEPGMVRQDQVDLQVVRAFLAGESLPLRGTDPMGSKTPLIFSAARFSGAAATSARPVTCTSCSMVRPAAPLPASSAFVVSGRARPRSR